MRRSVVLVLLVLLALPAQAGRERGQRSPEVDWFTYSQADRMFRWQTTEEYYVFGFTVVYGTPTQPYGGIGDPPDVLWSSGFIDVQHPGSGNGALYELQAPAALRMYQPWLCSWYWRHWVCDMQPEIVK